MNNLLQSIYKPFSRGTSQQGRTDPGGTSERSDRESDGFLLVGNTASERTTIHTSTFNADQIDAPPNYGEVSQNGLPSYQEYTRSTSYQSPTLDVAQYPGLTTSLPFQTGSTTMATRFPEQECVNPTDGSAHNSALAGVPFELGNLCAPNAILNDIRNNDLLRQKHFDMSLYDYDFNLEMTFLSEHDRVLAGGDRMDVAD